MKYAQRRGIAGGDVSGVPIVEEDLHREDTYRPRNIMPQHPWKRSNKYIPWYDMQTIMLLDYYYIPYFSVQYILELGGGNSTIWFAKRVEKVVTIETDVGWRRAIHKWAKEEGLENITTFPSLDYIQEASVNMLVVDLDDAQMNLEYVKKASKWTYGVVYVDNIKQWGKESSGYLAAEWLAKNGWGKSHITSDGCFLLRREGLPK